MRALVVLVLLAGCTDFASIDRGICGNGLLEPGEDCDSSDAQCVRCAVTCTKKTDCPTTDYECGVDGQCHAPGGGLASPRSAGTFQADDLRVTDIDHDGLGDAMGLSRTSVVVRHGEATGQLGTLDSLVTPTQTGPAALGDLDGDGSLDLTLTTIDGMVSYAATYGELAPIAVNGALVDGVTGKALDFRRFFHIAPLVVAGFVVDPVTNSVVIIIEDFSKGAPKNAGASAYPCAARIGPLAATAFDPTAVEVYNVNKDTEDTFDTIVSFVSGTGLNRKACITEIHRGAPPFPGLAPPAFTLTDITPSGIGSPTRRQVFADLDTDSDTCPGAVDVITDPNVLVYYDGARTGNGTSPCTLSTTSTPLPALGAPPNAVLLGSTPVSPTVPFIASDALITSEGVYPYAPAGVPIFDPGAKFYLVYRTIRTYAHLAHGDFDGDGNVDVVLSAAGDQDLDVLFRAKDNQAGFNLFRVDTASEVKSVTSGDFDGNGITDISYTEDLGDHQRLLVSYGTPDRPLPPVSVAQFTGILDVCRIGFPDSVDYLGLADDLLVLEPPAQGQTGERMSILHGSPQRTLLSYFDPRPESVRDTSVFRGAVIGNFVTGSSTPELQDLLALAPPTFSAVGTGQDVVKAYRVPNTPDGLDGSSAPGLTIDGLVDCSLNKTGRLCLDLAHYVAFPTGPQHDVVIGIDKSNAAVMVDPWGTSATAMTLDKLTALVPMKTTVQSLQIGDFDGDGVPELIAAFKPTDDTSQGAVIVCTMSAGVPTACQDVVPDILAQAATSGPEVKQCFDAAPARISYRDPTIAADGSADIAVACRGDGTSIFRVRHAAAGVVVERLVNTGTEISALRAGDVTGDRVDDLLLLEGDAVTSLVVYPQCSSREETTCHATSAGESP